MFQFCEDGSAICHLPDCITHLSSIVRRLPLANVEPGSSKLSLAFELAARVKRIEINRVTALERFGLEQLESEFVDD